MNAVSTFTARMSVAAAAAFFTVGASAQGFPDPSDEAALYEAARAEGELNWYNSAPLEPMQAVAAEFSRQYPGIRVNVLRIPGVQQYGRFMQETAAGQHIADIVHLSDFPSMRALIRDGHIAEWRVPTRERIPDDFAMGDHAYTNVVTDTAIIYNTNRVTPEEVEILSQGWEAVLDPRFKGRFTVTTQKCGICYAPIHMFLDPEHEERFGWEFIEAFIAQEPAVFSDNQIGIDRVVAGEYDFTFWSSGASAVTRFETGAPVRWLYMEPTPAYGNTWQGISAYAPNPNAARLFHNWSMGEEGAMALQTLYGGITTLQDFPDNREVAKLDWFQPITDAYIPDFDRWEASYHEEMDRYIELLGQIQ